MYFSSLFPYVVLACFLVRGLLLRGAVDGILHMFTPKVGVCGFHMGGVWRGGGALADPPGLVGFMRVYTQTQLCVRGFARLCRKAQERGRGSALMFQGEGHCFHLSRIKGSEERRHLK